MDNLAQRFAALDQIAVPELWPEIQRRATTAAPVSVTGSTIGLGRAGSRPQPSLLRMAVIAGALIAALALGAFVGSQLMQRQGPVVSTLLPTPTQESPSPAAGRRCGAMQEAASRPASGWAVGAAPQGTPQNGWIAAWNGSETPAVELLDAETGQVCQLIVFGDRVTPLGVPTQAGPRDWIPARGSLAWSPNGAALAILVVDREPPGQELFVWSADGLAGPLALADFPSTIDGVAWSPDGSWIAVTDTSHTVMPSTEASILIASANGERSQIDLECGKPCWADAPLISPDGRHIAALISGMDEGSGNEVVSWETIAIVDVESRAVQHLANSQELLTLRGLVGWAGPGELLLSENDGRLVGVPIDAATDTVDYLYQAPPQSKADLLGYSPNGTLRVVSFETTTGEGELAIRDGSPEFQTIATIDSPWGAMWWSPDGSQIGYLIDVQTDNQGIWTIEPDGDGQRLLAPGAFVIDSESRNVWQPVWPSR